MHPQIPRKMNRLWVSERRRASPSESPPAAATTPDLSRSPDGPGGRFPQKPPESVHCAKNKPQVEVAPPDCSSTKFFKKKTHPNFKERSQACDSPCNLRF